MMIYAQLDNLTPPFVRAIVQTAGPLVGARFVQIEQDDESLLGKQYVGGEFVDPPAQPDPVSLPPRAFLARFTAAERELLENKLATGTQAVKDKLAAFRFYVMTGGYVELDDDYIVAAVTAMESAGVLSAGRAAEILGV